MNGYLIDMDGVIYRGDHVVSGAIEFVAALQARQVPFMFLTNNSQRTRLDIVIKLRRMGFRDIEERHVFTCSIATARFLRSQKPDPTAFVIGEGGLLAALNHFGIGITDKEPDYVVVGEGRTISFEILEQATRHLVNGAKLIATNLDPNCPTANGPRPGTGAIIAMLERASGRTALGIGKPSPITMRLARKELGAQVVMVGDTLDTDILGGMQMGYQTVLVLSGGTLIEEVKLSPFLPDYVVESVGTLAKHLDADGSILLDPMRGIDLDKDSPVLTGGY